MDATMFVADNRGANDDLTVITGRPKFFLNRESWFNSSRYNIFFPAVMEQTEFWHTEYDGTEACALELLQRGEEGDFLLRVGEAAPASFSWGIMSRTDKERVETSAQLIQNDYFVRCEDDGVGRRHLLLSSGKTIETTKEVVLVNCRNGFRGNLFGQDVHPLRPDGSIQPGWCLGRSGASAYAITLLLLKDNLDMSFYGSRTEIKPGSLQWSVEMMLKATGNIMFKVPQLTKMGKDTLNPDFWLPAPRLLYAVGKMMRNADKIKTVCDTTLETLQPFS